MQVTCHCGQAFNIQAGRYPHRVSCHACGHKFLAFADGQTAPWEAGRTLHARCRCGQKFDVWTEQFPHEIRCGCGQHFSVLDTGETIGGEAPAVPPAVASASIQGDLRVVPASTAICEKDVADQLAASVGSTTLDKELLLVDRLWEAQQYHLRASVYVRRIVAVLLIPLAMLFLFWGVPCVVEILMIGLGVFLAAYKEPHRYDAGEEAWKRKRWELIVKYSRQDPEA